MSQDPVYLRFLESFGPGMTAASQVFAIPELLESILLHLPERDLLLAQRVKKAFRDVTTASLHLQRKLFLTADAKLDDELVPEWKWNPFIDIFRPRKGCTYPMPDLPRSTYMISWCIWRNANMESTMSIDEYIVLFSVQLDLKALRNADYSSASWKRMLFTQPALREMQMRNVFLCFHDFTFYPIHKIEDVKGVQTGQLIVIAWQGHAPATMDHSIITEFEHRGKPRL